MKMLLQVAKQDIGQLTDLLLSGRDFPGQGTENETSQLGI
jgi:hypothetical protein